MTTPTTSTGRPRTRALPTTAITERMAQTRQRLGLTQPRMALYLGVPTATYQSWEMGLRDPSASVLRLLDVLGVVEALAPGVHAQLMP
jgi:DNA-binding transcriptional regulator YiaG